MSTTSLSKRKLRTKPKISFVAHVIDAPKIQKFPPKLKGAELAYERQLRQVGRHVGQLIKALKIGDAASLVTIMQLLHNYADLLTPWATHTAKAMLNEVDSRDKKAWRQFGRVISSQLRHDITHTSLGDTMNKLLARQVHYIQSIPKDAARRVHELTLQGLENSLRASAFEAEIMRSGDVSQSHATLIARTEVSRTASVLTQARAQSAGSTHYIWRTSEDADVRPGHAAMDGRVCSWANPPAVRENNKIMHFHPGCIWNCRCWPEAIVE